MKNWKEISKVENESLRLALIQSKGETEEGFKAGFPQYFTGETQDYNEEDLASLIRILAEVKTTTQRTAICQEAELPVEVLCFEGSCCGSTDDISYVKSTYSTTANGTGERFYRTSKNVGERIFYKDIEWIILWDRFRAGDPYSFSFHSLGLLPVEFLS